MNRQTLSNAFSTAHSVERNRWLILAAYMTALLLSLVMVFVKLSIPINFGERQFLILFMLPILLSALLGGFWPGLIASLITGTATAYYLIPPHHHLAIASQYDLLQWCFLLSIGLLVSLLSEGMWRTMQRELSHWQQLAATQGELQQIQSRFKATFEQAAVGIAIVALDGRWLQVNHKLCAIIGYTPDELMHLTFQDITYPDDLDTDLNYVNQMLSGAIETYSLEKRYIHKNGRLFWINLTVALVRHHDTTPQYFISVIEDIDARKQAQSALSVSEAKLKVAQSLAGIGSWTWDVTTNIHIWSELIYHIYGRDPELPPANYPDVKQYFTPDSWAVLSAAVETAINSGKPYECDAEVVRPDGRHCWIVARGEASRNHQGKLLSLYGTVQDITERKLSENALRETQERLQLALTASQDGLWDWNIQTGVVYRSQRYFELVERSPGEDTQAFDFFKTTVHPDDIAYALASIEAHLQGQTPTIAFEYRLASVTPIKWILARGQIVARDNNGKPLRLVGTLSDITERKLSEANIQRLNEDLDLRVRQRTAELTAANQELDSFAYAVSHDLRAPLRAMSGFSQALQEDYADLLDATGRGYLDQIGIASSKMNDLIDGLLVLSRITSGGVRHDTIDLSELAERVLRELAQADPARQVQMHVQSGMSVSGDARMIDVLMRNLLGNAWKYTTTVAKPEIRVYCKHRHQHCYYCVADNGAGFNMAYAQRLFQPFQRLHRQDEFPGLGIGLATVKRIVLRHGGSIEAHGEIGQGAVICFTLPGQTNLSAQPHPTQH